MRKRGITIVAILLMLLVLATVIGAMTLAGSGTLNGQFVSTQGEEARRAAEAGAQAALATIQAGTSPLPGWIYNSTSVGPVPWQKMEHVESEFQVLHVDHSTAPTNPSWITLGNPAQGILPTVTSSSAAPPGASAQVPAVANLHYLLSTGRTRSRHFRSVGLLYTTSPVVRVLGLQIF